MPAEETAPAVPRLVFEVRYVFALCSFVLGRARELAGSARAGALDDRFATAGEADVLAGLSEVLRADLSVETPGREPRRSSLESLCLVAAGTVDDLGELAERLAGWYRHTEVAQIVSGLRHLHPVYRDLVWTPELARLRQWRELLADRATDAGLADHLQRIASFYATSWDAGIPFRVLLQPAIPGHSASSSIQGNVVALTVPGGPRDADRHLGIVAHEVCHGFEEQAAPRSGLHAARQPMPVARSVEVYGQLALDEALATAIGNGWVVRRLGGRSEPEEWYDNWHIRTFAIALHPSVDEYLDAGKTLDDDFLRRALTSYESSVGARMWDVDNLLTHVLVLTGEETAREPGGVTARLAGLVDHVAEAHELRGISESTLEMLESARCTRMVVLRVGDEAAVRTLRDRAGWLLDVDIPSGEPFVYGRTGRDEPAVFVVLVRTLADLDAAVDALRQRSFEAPVVAFVPSTV
jgi:hypothetical protein